MNRRSRLLLFVATFLCAVGASVAQPTLEVTPASITFGCTLPVEDSTRIFTVRNTGTEDVTITEFLAPTDFVAPPDRDVVLTPGEVRSFVLHFTPLSAGPLFRSASLTINTADDELQVPIAGQIGAEPIIGVNPTSIDFFDIVIGTTSAPICVTVSNPSCRPIEVRNATIDNPMFALSAPWPGTFVLGEGETRQFCVVFSPTAVGDQTGELLFEGELGKRSDVRLSGRGIRAEIAVEPSTVDFGLLDVGAQSNEVVVDIVNRGGQVATIDRPLVVTGLNAGDFTVTTAAPPFSVGPGERAPVRVRFRPSALGDRTARIVVENSTDSEPVIELRGRGSLFNVVASPTEVDMGDLLVGQTRIALDTIVVTNNGTDPVRIDSTTIEGADPAAFERFGFVTATMAPGTNYVLDIEFQPFAPRVLSADLVIWLGNGRTIRIPLRGRGIDTAAPRPRRLVGDTVATEVGVRSLVRFRFDPPLGAPDTSSRVELRLRLDPKALYPHRVIAAGVTASRSYTGDGIVDVTLSSTGALTLPWFDLEVEGLFTGRPTNVIMVESVEFSDPRVGTTPSPALVLLSGCDIDRTDTLLRYVRIEAMRPNPTAEVASVRYRSIGDATARILTSDGRIVALVDAPSTGGEARDLAFPVDELSNGTYLLELRGAASSDRRILMVNR